MYFAAVLTAISALSAISFAQSFDASNLTDADKHQWCTAQKTSCPLLCSQLAGNSLTTQSNTCDDGTLAYTCVCQNGQSPNLTQYSQTIPYFECTTTNDQCVANCGQDNACSNDCRANHPCGAQDPKRVNTSTSSATQSATGSGGGSSATGSSFATFGGGSEPTGSSGGSGGSGGVSGNGATGLAIDVGRTYGLVLVLGAVFAGFALVL